MKTLHYRLYQRGTRTGLSNLIMSLEVGVLMAQSMNRHLVIEGNNPPRANLRGKVPQTKVTDLFTLPVQWSEGTLSGPPLTDYNLWDCVYGTDSEEFKDGRPYTIENMDAPCVSIGAHTLTFYSSFMPGSRTPLIPREEYIDIAEEIATRIGAFNAIHMRRGDFKHAHPDDINQQRGEIDVISDNFNDSKPILIFTDDSNDPVFAPILDAFPHSEFAEDLLNEHTTYRNCPIQTAFIEQLVAAHSDDFIGSFKSTFTALIQRSRGLAGKQEQFKYLWNRYPSFSDGRMKPVADGPYSWNRYPAAIRNDWMREWPESFGAVVDKDGCVVIPI